MWYVGGVGKFLIFLFCKKKKDTRNSLDLMDMFITLLVVMVSQVYAYALTHQNVYIKCVQFLYRYISIKWGESLSLAALRELHLY